MTLSMAQTNGFKNKIITSKLFKINTSIYGGGKMEVMCVKKKVHQEWTNTLIQNINVNNCTHTFNKEIDIFLHLPSHIRGYTLVLGCVLGINTEDLQGPIIPYVIPDVCK